MMMLLHKYALGALGLLLAVISPVFAQTAPAAFEAADPKGISFYVLRVIYPEVERKGVTLTAYNKTAEPFLIQSRIRPVEAASGDVDMSPVAEARSMPFIVTPPLARLEANGELTLRIRRNTESLPTDRESVFFISMKAIPSQVAPEKRKQDAQQMVLTVVSNIKVFYRPAGLAKRAVAEVASQLRFRREGSWLMVDNPTPYWLTFSRLKVGISSLDKAQLRLMVPPKGQQHYRLPAGGMGAVSWQLIDEDGWDTPVEKQSL